MTLDNWMTERGMSNAQFAPQIDTTPEAVRRYRKGLRIPDKETMLKIGSVTAGNVTANDFFGMTSVKQDAAA
ncbi:MAG: helix-turn-helix domain-containing protein [Blastomonas fulva]|uniref:helix-turn-helix domain-containing protein n=1 Tax=Blastomonas fulva TaxID=1550728 RepID=UPI004034AD5A